MHWSKSRFIMGPALLLFTLSALASDVATPLHKKKYAMGTVFEILTYDTSLPHASEAIALAFQEIVHLDNIMSNYKPESDLSRLNRAAHFHAEAVPPDLYRTIEKSLQYSKLSGGKFDITVGPLVNRWKAVMRGEPAPSTAEEQQLRTCIGYEKIQLLSDNRIEFLSECLEIDLGAIGKGYAVDRAADILRAHGIRNALINAGGSTIYGMGCSPGQPGWLVNLRDPSQRLDPQIVLTDNSVSTSEQTPASLLGARSAGHIVDPPKGEPLKTPFAVSVVAKTATASDALSTTLLLVGPQEGKRVVKNTAEVAAIWISADGQTESASNGPQIVLGRMRHGTRKSEAAGLR
ncbi:MAG TPA: FAD:protein FMN transferase [Terriglobales bacterium]|nr:FAD:protein FMN transferase [Terriglobales bacterium]